MIHIEKGQIFGKLSYIKDAKRKMLPSGQRPRRILCKCFCGNIRDYLLLHVIRGRIQTCGCNRAKVCKGEARLYNSWRAMKNRVKENYTIGKHLYIDRGISVIEEWNNFNVFKKWALKNGYKPGLTIDRVNNNLGYSPTNCRWVSQMENCNNRRNTFMVVYEGRSVALMILLREKNLIYSHGTIMTRIKRGWSVDEAINTPIKKGKYKNGGYKYEWANPK